MPRHRCRGRTVCPTASAEPSATKPLPRGYGCWQPRLGGRVDRVCAEPDDGARPVVLGPRESLALTRTLARTLARARTRTRTLTLTPTQTLTLTLTLALTR